MEITFEPGDVVKLKSGGPKMTVAQVAEQPVDVFCYWFDGGTNKSDYFCKEALEPVEKPKP